MTTVGLIGCKPPAAYEWGHYEDRLYKLMKDPSSLNDYGTALDRHIQEYEQGGRLPPGILAEYGYFLMASNRPGEAIRFFEKEKARWPESTGLMNRMISNCSSPKATQVKSGSVSPSAVVPAAPIPVNAKES